jgi:hypothetical protein
MRLHDRHKAHYATSVVHDALAKGREGEDVSAAVVDGSELNWFKTW